MARLATIHAFIETVRWIPRPTDWRLSGERMGHDERAQAAAARSSVQAWFERALEGLEALLVPTTPYPAFLADAAEVTGPAGYRVGIDRVTVGRLTTVANLAGVPALNIPAGRTTGGLPIGISLIGRRGADRLLLDLARLWEATTGHAPAHPPLPSRPWPAFQSTTPNAAETLSAR